MFRRLGEARPATIKVLEGRARGAGTESLYACDMRFASAGHAVIGRPEAGTGVFPARVRCSSSYGSPAAVRPCR
ncbi:hypothetical protein [Streptomyces sp. NPDC049949]|uniref:hypothetical protein n=1 Tax=Streptomyces sp. NPDC049949 TaxID=3154627 RepID=UPI0034130A6D